MGRRILNQVFEHKNVIYPCRKVGSKFYTGWADVESGDVIGHDGRQYLVNDVRGIGIGTTTVITATMSKEDF